MWPAVEMEAFPFQGFVVSRYGMKNSELVRKPMRMFAMERILFFFFLQVAVSSAYCKRPHNLNRLLLKGKQIKQCNGVGGAFVLTVKHLSKSA